MYCHTAVSFVFIFTRSCLIIPCCIHIFAPHPINPSTHYSFVRGASMLLSTLSLVCWFTRFVGGFVASLGSLVCWFVHSSIRRFIRPSVRPSVIREHLLQCVTKKRQKNGIVNSLDVNLLTELPNARLKARETQGNAQASFIYSFSQPGSERQKQPKVRLACSHFLGLSADYM